MFTCRICGALVGDCNRHATWHIQSGDVPPERSWECPLDGSPVTSSSSNAAGSDTWYLCGHRVVLAVPVEAGGSRGE